MIDLLKQISDKMQLTHQYFFYKDLVSLRKSIVCCSFIHIEVFTCFLLLFTVLCLKLLVTSLKGNSVTLQITHNKKELLLNVTLELLF